MSAQPHNSVVITLKNCKHTDLRRAWSQYIRKLNLHQISLWRRYTRVTVETSFPPLQSRHPEPNQVLNVGWRCIAIGFLLSDALCYRISFWNIVHVAGCLTLRCLRSFLRLKGGRNQQPDGWRISAEPKRCSEHLSVSVCDHGRRGTLLLKLPPDAADLTSNRR